MAHAAAMYAAGNTTELGGGVLFGATILPDPTQLLVIAQANMYLDFQFSLLPSAFLSIINTVQKERKDFFQERNGSTTTLEIKFFNKKKKKKSSSK